MEDKKTDVTKMLTMNSSLMSLLDYYEKDEIIDVYVYDLIAALLVSYAAQKESTKKTENIDSYVVTILSEADQNDEIHVSQEKLSLIVKKLGSYPISRNLANLLLTKFNIREELIETKFKLNSHVTPDKDILQLKKDYIALLMQEKHVSAHILSLNYKENNNYYTLEELTNNNKLFDKIYTTTELANLIHSKKIQEYEQQIKATYSESEKKKKNR